MPVFVATANRGKLFEMQALFAGTEFAIQTYPRYVSPIEGSRSYTENAALKAHALYDLLRADGVAGDVLADDSGLEVRALGGAPGVVTADYGGPEADWPQRRALLLAELAANGGTDRAARFVCALHFIDRAGREFGTFATVDGAIAPAERGTLGFSFDPIFLYPPAGRTFAELTDAQKNAVSHRAIAAAAIVAAIRAAGISLGAAPASRHAASAPGIVGSTGRSSAW